MGFTISVGNHTICPELHLATKVWSCLL